MLAGSAKYDYRKEMNTFDYVVETPNGKAMLINIQHPGEGTKAADVTNRAKYTSQWPANHGYGAGKRLRSAPVVITKKDGGVIGS